MSKSASRRVLLQPTRPHRAGIHADLVGDDQLSGGVGAWDTLARPRRLDAIAWTGTSSLTYVLPLLLDGMERSRGRDEPVEAECRALLQWSGRATRETDEPCILRLRGPLQSPESTRWVITDLAWGAKVRNKHGRRVQQYVTVTLRQHIDAAVLTSPAAKSKARRGKK